MYNFFFIKKNYLNNIVYICDKSIKYVGIKNLYSPIIIDNGFNIYKTLAAWNLNIYLKSCIRGSHMSRFLYIIDKISKKPINIKNFITSGKNFLNKLKSIKLNLQLSFPIYIKKLSPITKLKSFSIYKVNILFKKNLINNIIIYKLFIPVMTLCPCSKLISKTNSHNQRSFINIYIKSNNININFLYYIKLVEHESSSQLWNLLKRIDEKFVTEFSYKNPKFVEDLIRNIFFKLKKNIISLIIKIENFESIHNHNVYSLLKY